MMNPLAHRVHRHCRALLPLTSTLSMPTPSPLANDDNIGPSVPATHNRNRNILQSEAVRLHKRGDLNGPRHTYARGVFLAGLCACAVGARDAAEALPFVKRLHEETDEPGFVLAHYAISADSAPFLEALIELGLLSPQGTLVWSGYRTSNTEMVKDYDAMGEAIHSGSARCARFLMDKVSSQDLLAAATVERYAAVFELFLEHAQKTGNATEINRAMARICDASRLTWSSDLLNGDAIVQKLMDAGACLDFNAGSPKSWSSWNGSTVENIETVFAPSLKLCEAGDEIPLGASREGYLPGSIFFSNWSSAALLARTAVEAGANEIAAMMLAAATGWDQARASGSLMTPLSLMAMMDPSTTDSGLHRALLPTADIIAQCADAHPESLFDTEPFSLCKVAIGRWLWGAPASWNPQAPGGVAKRASYGISPDPLVGQLSTLCAKHNATPLGVEGAFVAAQEFVGRLGFFTPMIYQKYDNSRLVERERAQRASHRAKIERQMLTSELEACHQLARFMPDVVSGPFISTVEACHARGKIENESERLCFMESALFSLNTAPSTSRRSLAL